MKFTKLVFTALLFAQCSFAQSWQDTIAMLDKIIAQYPVSNPGGQLSVERNGQVIYSKAVGMADMERNVPLTTNSVIEAGSVSKQLTAAAILLLEQEGKLSLDDDVRKYVPELPDYGTTVKLSHMLHHTSGLRDWGSVTALSGWARSSKFYTNDDALEIIARQKHLNHQPGDEYIYSNSNFNLFAIIVQRVSGLSLAAFTKKYIFEPAGMTHTQWRDDPNRIVANRAIAYSKTDTSYQIDMPNEYVYGNGGLLTTTEDLLKWSDFYQQGKMGSASLFSKQIQTVPLNNGKENTYGAGLVIKKVMGWNNISHSGATAGYRAYLETFPELKLSIAALSNTPEFSTSVVAGQVRKIFVADHSEKPVIKDSLSKKESVYMPAPATLQTVTGKYQPDSGGATFQLTVKDSRLLMNGRTDLKPIGENTFATNNMVMLISGNKGMYRVGSDTVRFTKVPEPGPLPEELVAYEGKYFSEETNSMLTITHQDTMLMIRLNANLIFRLTPTSPDAFVIEDWGARLQFNRNKKKRTLVLKISSERARNVEFQKLP